MPPPRWNGSNTGRPLLLLAGAVVALKVTLLLADPVVRLYLGDSGAYLYGAMDEGRLPDDRSFLYSLLIRTVAPPSTPLEVLTWWQSAAGAATALILYWSLRGRTRHSALPIAAALLFAVEPAQLYYERMVLAESFGLLSFALFFAASLAYVRSRSAWWLPVAAGLGMLAAAFRLNYLPAAIGLTLVVPFVPALAGTRPPVRDLARHFVVAACAVVIVHSAYRAVVAQVFNTSPGYLARAGFMQFALVAPLVTPDHLQRAGLPPDIETRLTAPLGDRLSRQQHVWMEGGLVRTLRAMNIPVEPVMRELTWVAVRDDPFGIVRLGVATLFDYFRENEIRVALENDLGQREIPPEMLWTLKEHWHYDATGLPTRVTLVSRMFEGWTWGLVACLFLLPVVALARVARGSDSKKAEAALAAAFGLTLFLSHVLFTPMALYRYLHPLPFFVLLNAVPLLGRRSRRRV